VELTHNVAHMGPDTSKPNALQSQGSVKVVNDKLVVVNAVRLFFSLELGRDYISDSVNIRDPIPPPYSRLTSRIRLSSG
jgi:hypothetical protein